MPKVWQLEVATIPSTEASRPFFGFPASDEKNWPKPHVSVPLFGKNVQSNTPMIGSSGCQRRRKTIRLNQTYWNAFLKWRRKVCS